MGKCAELRAARPKLEAKVKLKQEFAKPVSRGAAASQTAVQKHLVANRADLNAAEVRAVSLRKEVEALKATKVKAEKEHKEAEARAASLRAKVKVLEAKVQDPGQKKQSQVPNRQTKWSMQRKQSQVPNHPTKWREEVGHDAFPGDNAERIKVSTSSIPKCKQLCMSKGYGGFAVWNGSAYFRRQTREELLHAMQKRAPPKGIVQTLYIAPTYSTLQSVARRAVHTGKLMKKTKNGIYYGRPKQERPPNFDEGESKWRRRMKVRFWNRERKLLVPPNWKKIPIWREALKNEANADHVRKEIIAISQKRYNDIEKMLAKGSV